MFTEESIRKSIETRRNKQKNKVDFLNYYAGKYLIDLTAYQANNILLCVFNSSITSKLLHNYFGKKFRNGGGHTKNKISYDNLKDDYEEFLLLKEMNKIQVKKSKQKVKV